MEQSALQTAVKLLGGQTQMAKKLGLKQQNVWVWLRSGTVPAEYCPEIEEATSGQVTAEQLRPDVAWHVIRAGAGQFPNHANTDPGITQHNLDRQVDGGTSTEVA